MWSSYIPCWHRMRSEPWGMRCRSEEKWWPLPSGKRSHNYGLNHHAINGKINYFDWAFRVRRDASSFWVMIQSLPVAADLHMEQTMFCRGHWSCAPSWAKAQCGARVVGRWVPKAADMQLTCSWHPLTTNQRFTLQRDLFFQSFLLSVFCPFKTSSHGFCSAHALTALLNKGDLWPLTRWSRRSRRSIRELCGEWNRNVRHVRLEMQQPRAEWWISETNDLCDPDVNFMNFES